MLAELFIHYRYIDQNEFNGNFHVTLDEIGEDTPAPCSEIERPTDLPAAPAPTER